MLTTLRSRRPVAETYVASVLAVLCRGAVMRHARAATVHGVDPVTSAQPSAKRLEFMKLAVPFLMCLVLPAVAHADPCEAPVSHFRQGDAFSGTVRYVGDGDSLCVGRGPNPDTWVEVRLGDFNAPELAETRGEEGKAFLSQHLGDEVTCTVGGGRGGRVVSYDRVIAICRIQGIRLGDVLRRAGSPERGR